MYLKKRKDEGDQLEYALYLLAGQSAYGRECTVEAFHLTDGESSPIELTERKLGNRREKVEAMVSAISNGEFPAVTDQFSCPRCPHFFYCPSVPTGTLTIVSDSED